MEAGKNEGKQPANGATASEGKNFGDMISKRNG